MSEWFWIIVGAILFAVGIRLFLRALRLIMIIINSMFNSAERKIKEKFGDK